MTSSSCELDASVMLSAGGVCNGAGTCVNSTANPSRLLCLCNSLYSGGSDFFDTRVEWLPDGTVLSLGCGDSFIGTYIIWGIAALIGLIRMKQLTPVFLTFYRKYRVESEKGTYRGIEKDFALRVVTWDLVVATTGYWIIVIGQLSGMVMGTDALITILLPLTVLAFNMTQYWITQREFVIFLQGTMSAKNARATAAFRRNLKLANLFIYFCVNGGGTFWSLSVDKSKGPVENMEFLAIIFRNGSTIVWGLSELLATAMVRRQLLHTLKLHSSDPNGSIVTGTSDQNESQKRSSKRPVTDGSEMDAKTQAAIKRMQAEIHSVMVFLMSAVLMYGTFLIPHLYPFQTYSIAFVVGGGSMRHAGKAFQVDSTKAVANNDGAANNTQSSSKDGAIAAAVSPVQSNNSTCRD